VQTDLSHHQRQHIRDAKALAASVEGILYEHHDGRRKVASSPDAAQFTQGEPGWYRVGPVDVSELGRA